MDTKPEQFRAEYAESFKARQVATDYRFRPPYPEEVFTLLQELLGDEPRTILDVGAGSGDLARRCVEFAARVDAVDFSEQMIATGKQLPNGDNPRLHWIYGKVEDAPLAPPYALITAGSSIHWPDWSIAFPRFRELLTPSGYLVIIYRGARSTPWDAELRELRQHCSIRRNHLSANAVAELEARGYLQVVGRKETAPVAYQRSVEDYIAGLHSHSGMARECMGQESADEFDALARKLLLRFCPGGILPLQVTAQITWGKPLAGRAK